MRRLLTACFTVTAQLPDPEGRPLVVFIDEADGLVGEAARPNWPC